MSAAHIWQERAGGECCRRCGMVRLPDVTGRRWLWQRGHRSGVGLVPACGAVREGGAR